MLVPLPAELLGPWLPVVVLLLREEALVRSRHPLWDQVQGWLAA